MVTEAVKPMAGDVAGNDDGAVTDSRSLVDSLVARERWIPCSNG